MAIYHLTTKPVSRKGGRSATAAAAYRAAELVHDHTTGQTFDYTRKRGVEHSEIVLPSECAKRDINWARNREALWNAAERAENRSNSRVAREYELALPYEMTREQRVELVRSFSQGLADRYGVAVDFALHEPHREGDRRNFHAHVLTTTRSIEAGGLGPKAELEWSETNRKRAGLVPGPDELTAVRARWTELANERLAELGIDARIDHRTLEAQGIDRIPTTHLGVAVSGMERRGIRTEVAKRIDLQRELEAQKRLERAAELGRLEREGQGLSKSILDLSADIRVALKERDRGLQPEGPTPSVPGKEPEGRELSAAERLRLKSDQVAQRLAAEREASQPARETVERERELELKRQLELEEQKKLERGKDRGLER